MDTKPNYQQVKSSAVSLLEDEAQRHRKEDERRHLISASISSLSKPQPVPVKDPLTALPQALRPSQPSSSSLSVGALTYDPEEERRDARRRHRKRLAVIVVDHWKHFARERLDALKADRHYHRQLLIAAFYTLRQNSRDAANAWRQAAVMDIRKGFLILGQCLVGWRRVAVKLLRDRKCVALLKRGRDVKTKRSVIRSWRERCFQGGAKRRDKLKAWYFYSFIALSRAIRGWREAIVIQTIKRSMLVRARELFLDHLRVTAWVSWRRAIGMVKAKRAREAVADLHWRSSLASQCLRGWRRVSTLQSTQRRSACLVLAAMEDLRVRDQARDGLRLWRNWALRRKELRGIVGTTLHNRSRSIQHAVVDGWKGVVKHNKYLHQCGLVMEAVGMRWTLSLFLARWVRGISVQQEELGKRARDMVLVKATFLILARYLLHQKTQQRMCQQATLYSNGTRLGRCLVLWISYWRRWVAKKKVLAMIDAWRKARTLKIGVRAWKEGVLLCEEKRRQADLSHQHIERRRWRRVLKAWTMFVWWQRLKSDVVKWRAAKLLASSTRAWLHLTRLEKTEELQRRVAVRHRYLSLLSSGLMWLRSAILRRRDYEVLADQATNKRSLRIVKSCLEAWRLDYLPQQLVKKSKCKTALDHFGSVLASKAIQGWREESIRLASEKKEERQAESWSHQRLQSRVLVLWFDVSLKLRESRRDKALRLHLLTSALSTQKLQRIFSSWSTLHHEWVKKRENTDLARGHWRAATLTSCLSLWRAWVQGWQREKEMDFMADESRRTRLLKIVIRVWVSHVEAWKQGHRSFTRAFQHRIKSLSKRAVSGWSSYISDKKGQAEDRERAWEMLAIRLQREECLKGLRVGSWSQTERLETLAQTMTAQLALVEPYAMHWRRVTVQRKKERLAQALNLVDPNLLLMRERGGRAHQRASPRLFTESLGLIDRGDSVTSKLKPSSSQAKEPETSTESLGSKEGILLAGMAGGLGGKGLGGVVQKRQRPQPRRWSNTPTPTHSEAALIETKLEPSHVFI